MSTTRAEEVVFGEPKRPVGLEPPTRCRCTDPPDEDRVRRRDLRRHLLLPIRGEPGGGPRGRRLCMEVEHSELPGYLCMAEGRLEERVSRRAECSVRRKGKWFMAGFLQPKVHPELMCFGLWW